jgi:hypothetical protein
MSSYKENHVINITGYFTEYDQYNKAKLMFLDDYDNLQKLSFTKSYMLHKEKTIEGKAPLIDNKYMLINCPKYCMGNLPDTLENKTKIKIIPIISLIQHKVKCDVVIKTYKFNKGSNTMQGWYIKLLKMTLLEL